MRVPPIAPILVLALLLSGCTSVDDGPADIASTDLVIDDPNDFSYLQDASASARPHVHDYWGGKTEMTLADGKMTWQGYFAAGGQGGFGSTGLTIPDGSMVIPGTKWINITARWTNKYSFPVEFFVEYQTANATVGRIKVPTGETVSVEVAEEMNDLAHAKRTRWMFRPDVKGTGNAWYADVSAEVRVDIARKDGALPYAPAHVDAWGPNKTQSVFSKQGRLADAAGAGRAQNTAEAPPINLQIKPVPLETSLLRVRFTYNSTTSTQVHYNPVLDYRGADRSSNAPAYAVKPTRRDARNVGGLIEWEIAVKPEMWDSPYSSRSDWQLSVFWGGETASSRSTMGPHWMQGDYRLEVVAERA